MPVRRNVRSVVCVVCLLMMSALLGCSSMDPIAFHDKVLDEMNKLDASISTLQEPTKAARAGSPGGAEALNTAYEGVKKTCSEVKKELAEMRAPSDEKLKAYFTAATNYVETMDRAMHEEFPHILQILTDNSLSTDEKLVRTRSLGQAITEKKKSALEALWAANAELVKALNIPMPPKSDAPYHNS